VVIWDVDRTGQVSRARILPGHTGKVTDVAMLNDGRTVLSLGEDGLLIRDAVTGKSKGRQPTGYRASAMALSPRGEVLATRNFKTVRYWRLPDMLHNDK
jgi:hypothetical protein